MTREEFQKRYGYDANSRLGNGAFGSVFKAWDDVKNCHVALKIQAVNSKMPDIRLRREVEMAASLNHPNVAHYDTCYTFEDLNGESDVAVMSYYEHGSLDNLLRSVDLTMEQREDILVQILDGIAYLHYNGIIHRDLKPQNILILHLKGRYIPKITDFGISKQLRNSDGSLLYNSIIGGTENYGAPEQMAGREIRKNADLWSFGIIAMQMMCNMDGFDYADINKGILPAELNKMSMQWQALVRQCLIPDHNKRISSADECLSIIGKSLTFDPKNMGKSKKPQVDSNDGGTIIEKQQDKGDKPKKKRGGFWMFLLVLLVLAAAAAYYFMGEKSTTAEVAKIVEESAEQVTVGGGNGTPDTGPETGPEQDPQTGNTTPQIAQDDGPNKIDNDTPETGQDQDTPTGNTTPQKTQENGKNKGGNETQKGGNEQGGTTPQTGGKEGGDDQSKTKPPTPEPPTPEPVGDTVFTLKTKSMEVSSEAGSYVIEYTIKNPIRGQSVGLGETAFWITNLDTDQDGKIRFNTTTNKKSKPQTATIKVSYNNQHYSITVVQRAAGE